MMLIYSVLPMVYGRLQAQIRTYDVSIVLQNGFKLSQSLS
jgi:hypothetical protein